MRPTIPKQKDTVNQTMVQNVMEKIPLIKAPLIQEEEEEEGRTIKGH